MSRHSAHKATRLDEIEARLIAERGRLDALLHLLNPVSDPGTYLGPA